MCGRGRGAHPWVLLAHRLEREVCGGGSNSRGQVLEHLVLLQRKLDKVVGEQLGLGARRSEDVRDLGEALEEDERIRRGQLEVELGEHEAFHLKDLLARVRLVGDVHEITALGSVDLLVLGRDEHRGHTDELQLVARNRLLLEESVDQVGGEVEGLRHELEFEVDLNEPVDQNRTHLLVNVRLLRHEVGRREVDALSR